MFTADNSLRRGTQIGSRALWLTSTIGLRGGLPGTSAVPPRGCHLPTLCHISGTLRTSRRRLAGTLPGPGDRFLGNYLGC